MRAALLYAPGDIRVEETAKPVINDDEFLIRVKKVGLCGSDIRTIKFGHKRIPAYPQILGHEIAGEVVEIGANVKGRTVGERVYVSPVVPCFSCPACRKGWYSQCQDLVVPGTTIPGGYAEYMKVTKEIIEHGQIIPMQDSMSYEQAVMTEPLSSVYAAQQNANVKLGDTVVVIGTGPIGCLHIELAKIRGAVKVIAIEMSEPRLEMAKQFGADHLINSANEDPVAKVLELTDGWGADVVISANPATQAQIQAVEMAAMRARVVFFGGVPAGKLTSIDTNIVHYKQLVILGHFGYDHIQNYEAFKLIESGRLDAMRYVTHQLPLSEIEKGIALTQTGEAIKVVLDPSA